MGAARVIDDFVPVELRVFALHIEHVIITISAASVRNVRFQIRTVGDACELLHPTE